MSIIFVKLRTREFFRTTVLDPVEGFKKFRDYRLACGDVDSQSFDNDRQDLVDTGWVEIPSPQFITVKLYYMKDSGKFYSEGELKVNRGEAAAEPAKNWMLLMDQVRALLDSGSLPGLVKGSKFDVFVVGDEHPGGYPHLFRI